MTDSPGPRVYGVPGIVPPDIQRAVWFLGKLILVRADAEATGGRLAILEHEAERGFASPVHQHDVDDETFFVLDGELRVEVDGERRAAGAGAVAFLPRGRPHSVVVTSPQVHYLTLHSPAGGFDAFTEAVGTPAAPTDAAPPDEPLPDQAALARVARQYGIEFLGPPPVP